MAYRAMRATACDRCDFETPARLTDYSEQDDYGRCECGGTLRFKPERFATDLYGSPVYSDAVGGYVRSTRERDQIMRRVHERIGESGYTVSEFRPCGDKVHGARPDLSIRGSAFSFAGQASRTSTGERELSRSTSRRSET